jgi:hypothetical protein
MSRKSVITIAYWSTTALVASAMTGGGVGYLLRTELAVKSFQQLGYPAYLLTLIGAWKVLGAAAILAPRAPRLKEWAYAGIVFDLTGAVLSHLAVGDPLTLALPASIVAMLALASWALRPSSRRLGAVLPDRPSRAQAPTSGADLASAPS